MITFFSVCNRRQIPETFVLAESIRVHHPGSRIVIGLADEVVLNKIPEGIEILPISSIALPNLNTMSAQYRDFEFVHAVRPWFARHLISKLAPGHSCVFLAPTVRVFQPLTEILSMPGEFIVTPHITKRLPESGILDDKRILNIGMFHSNAWIARNTPDVSKLLDWWCERTIDRAYFDLCNGMCLDQLWLNYVPIHVKNWKVIRNPAWHLGLHNALQHPLKMVGKVPVTEDHRVITIDYAGIQGFHPVWSDHHRIITNSPNWYPLIHSYWADVKNFSKPDFDGIATFGKPTPISPFRDFRKAIKSELDEIIRLIDKIEI